jgi:CubicO group peptidase (beta-lactamase class C family)
MERVSAESLAGYVREARERWSIPGMAVGLLQAGETVIATAGVCELGVDEPVSPETSFRIASITKPFTATLALTLVQDGLLALDEPPPGSRVQATVRELLSHAGGLACEWPAALDELGSGDDALLRVAGGEPERLPIGSGELFSYSNVGFWLVGAAAARVCNTTFAEAIRPRVLDPLGLEATRFEPRQHARGHDQVEPGSPEHRPVEHPYPRARTPSGGLWSTVEELLRFAAHHLGGPGPLMPEAVEEMQRPHVAAPGGSYGLGWFLRDVDRRPIVEHPGSAAGYQSLLSMLPDEGTAFAALTNSSRGSAAIRDILERLRVAPRRPPQFELTAQQLAKFAGSYAGNGIAVDVVVEDGGLRTRQTEFDPLSGETVVYPRLLARPVGEREFEIVDGERRGDRLTFPRDDFICAGVLAPRIE